MKVKVPADWGRDELTSFFGQLDGAAYASFANLRPLFQVAIDVDQSVVMRTSEIFKDLHELVTSTSLFNRMFSVQRAAFKLAASGQLFECRVLIRSAIECGVYAWCCARDLDLQAAWQGRGGSADERKLARKMLQWSLLSKQLAANRPDLAAIVHELYEESIDFGAHPNIDGIGLSSDVTDLEGGRINLQTIFMHGDAVAMQLGMMNVIQVMFLGFDLIAAILPVRTYLLNMHETMRRSKQAFGAVAAQMRD